MVSELHSGDPQTIGPYRLVGRLGAGGMGQVFLGVSPGGRPVAVKAIRAELAEDPQFRMRFGREVDAARKVSGVFTAMVVDADIDGPVAWLATAYVPGPSLAEAVDSHGPLPEGSVLALAAALAESLTAIHAAEVVHRDLKPSNVLLAEDGPRVIDFGISRAAEATALTRTGLVIGSPGFMSPEQAMGGDVGKPSDIFSLGAVLAFSATGEEPFGAGTTAALLYRVVSGTPDLDRVPATVRPLVERCLAKDPAQRPTAADLLAEVGALQPAGNWLPDSLIRAFPPDTAPGPALARPDPALTRPGTASAPTTAAWPEQTTTSATAAGAAARMPTRDSQPLAAAAADSLAVTPGSPPSGGAPDPARPGGRNRPRLRRRRPLVLASVIGILIGGPIAAFAMTTSSGHAPSPVQSKVALTSSPMAQASGGHTVPGASSSTDASMAVSSPGASQAVSSPAGASSTASTSASASASPPPATSSSTTRSTPTPTPPTPTPTTPTPTAPSTPTPTPTTPTPTAPSTPQSSPTAANTPPPSPASTPASTSANTSPPAPASTSP